MKIPKILITGGSGFVGQHLARLLLAEGHPVASVQECHPVLMPAGVECLCVDLADRRALQALPRDWDWVIHLAGASIPSQFTSTDLVVLNTQITLNLLEHLEGARVLLVSSCHVYAPTLARRTEDSRIVPQGRYGLSKHLLEQMAGHYEQKLDIRVARPFNHLGPHQRPELVIPTLLRRIREGQGPILMQGTNSIRDFIDVADVVAAYLAILRIEAPEQRVFNVCTGIPRTIKEVADAALEILGLQREVSFAGHPNSEDDNPFVVGDPERLMAATNWRPRIALPESLERMLAV